MKKIISEYKPFLLFLGKFLLSYLILTILYQIYLGGYDSSKNEVDGFTGLVAEQTISIMKWVDAGARATWSANEPSVNIIYHSKPVSRIIEGCNALSVIILFWAFVISFTGKFKKTILFLFLGSILIYVLNIGRIALLSIALFHFPQYEHFLHGVLFPLIIYGFVFILWVLWVNKYSEYATKIKRK